MPPRADYRKDGWGEVEVTASAVVAAIRAYSKINAAGEWIDRTVRLQIGLRLLRGA